MEINNANALTHESEINEMAALLPEEYQELLGTYQPVDEPLLAPMEESNRTRRAVLPNAVDWRTKGIVTPVKNQGEKSSILKFIYSN